MKAVKIILFLLFSISYSEIEIEIRNGETIELPSDSTTFNVTYHFIIPESEIYKRAILVFKFDYDERRPMHMYIIEDGNEDLWSCRNVFTDYTLESINNKTITFAISNYNHNLAKFTLLDLTKEIKTSLDNLKNIIPPKFEFLYFFFEPYCKFNYDIEEISSEQTYFFLENEKKSPQSIIGEGYIEYCEDEDCQNNKYYPSKVIKFKKGSKYKMKINYIIYNFQYYYFPSFKIMKYSEPKELNYGAQIYNIDKSNLDNFYIINSEIMKTLKLYCTSYKSIIYSFISKKDFTNLPNSLNEKEFNDYTPLSEINIYSDFLLMILTDNEVYEKNIIYNYNHLYNITKSFESFTLFKENYSLIMFDERYAMEENY